METRGRKKIIQENKRTKRVYTYFTKEEYEHVLEQEKLVQKKYPTITKQDVARASMQSMNDKELLVKIGLIGLDTQLSDVLFTK